MTSIRLTDLQLVLLSAAAARPDSMLLPPPDSVRARGKTLERTLTKLLERELVEEVSARHEAEAWRETEDGARLGLRLAPAGRGALGLGDERETEGTPTGSVDLEDGADPARDDVADLQTTTTAPRLRPGTKQARLVEMLSQPDGAGIAAVSRALGWQGHTARAAITGLRKKGFDVQTRRDADGRTIYSIRVERASDAA